MKSILIGSVGTSRVMLEAMIQINFPITHVFSIDERFSTNISGYFPIHTIAQKHGIPFTVINKINDKENILKIKEIAPDYIFVIGFSQLVKKEIIDSAKKGVIGFHPTPLPKMRGRAAIVWQILLGVKETKCSMFFIDEGMDSGDILGQENYVISESDYAFDVHKKLESAFEKLSKRVLQEIIDGSISPIKQNHNEATYLLKRSPDDGLIDWNKSISDIHLLIRATSRPYPGAFAFYDGTHKIVIWRADILKNDKYFGLNGQIAEISDEYIDVVCKDGILRIIEFENEDDVKIIVGHKMR